jgi:S-DNA-T family DNA segregation ATPase FtsK/SpoIIIE
MTYSLHTLHGDATDSSPQSAGWVRFANEIALFFGFFLLLFLLLAFLTYAPQDAAWTTSGAVQAPLNRAGRLGAWIADVS